MMKPNNWFGGDRTFEQQMTGLDWLKDVCHGRTILDFGCAEGLISIEMLRHGATHVHGIELVLERVKAARVNARGYASLFETGDANAWKPTKRYGVVLALAILHKLTDPSAVARRLARAADHAVVLRLPPRGAVVIDPRSKNVPHDLGAVLVDEGFVLEPKVSGNYGPLEEWIGLYWKAT